MRVLDAGVVVDLLVGALEPEHLGEEELAAPHLLDSEVLSALRRLVLHGDLSEAQGQSAVDGFGELTVTRYPAHRLRPRVWELRHTVSADDATYIALTERLQATMLLTTDGRLARAPGVRCPVQVL